MRNAVLSFLLIVTVLFCFHPLSLLTNAAPCAEEIAGTVITFDDGSYLTVSPVRTVTSEEQGGTRTVTTMQEKDVIYTNADGVDEWKYTLTGNFTYQYGAFAVCNYAYYSQTVYEGNWTFSNGSADYSGSTARGTGNFKETFLFITLHDIDINISITCDVYGHFS